MDKQPLLEIQDLKMYFPLRKGFFGGKVSYVKAVDGVSFSIEKGKTLGLVGESGCGKTTVGCSILKLYEPTGGKIIYEGKEIQDLSPAEMFPLRKKMQMIFQDPYSSLNPRMTVGDIIMEPMFIHNLYGNTKRRSAYARELLQRVGLKQEHFDRYPHEFSGGQRQRVGIARALAMEPEFIVCDEPISALDVSIQAQVVNILENLQKELGLTYLFISHDLSMVRHISHKVGVMYLGNLVEYADTEELYENMTHPYTQALLSAVPVIEDAFTSEKKQVLLQGDVPSPINPPNGCVFSTRCPKVSEECRVSRPQLKDIGGGHLVACHLVWR
jgi:oligopeptide transport system ATP-binding protein